MVAYLVAYYSLVRLEESDSGSLKQVCKVARGTASAAEFFDKDDDNEIAVAVLGGPIMTAAASAPSPRARR